MTAIWTEVRSESGFNKVKPLSPVEIRFGYKHIGFWCPACRLFKLVPEVWRVAEKTTVVQGSSPDGRRKGSVCK